METTVKIQRTLKIPSTVAELELYPGPGASAAARAIGRAVKRAIESSATSYEALCKVDPVLTKYRRFGACDTEPLCAVERAIRTAFGDEHFCAR